MRIMAIDLGDVRTGLAFSDLTGTICGEAFTIEEKNLRRLSDRIVSEAKNREVSRIVLGYPKNMDGSIGDRAKKSEELKAILEEKTSLPVTLWDERRTSVSAHAILHANGKKMKKHKKTVDAVAAALILEGFLGT